MKAIDIEVAELREAARGCEQARRLVSAIAQALADIDKRLKKAVVLLNVLEFRTRHAREVTEDEN